MLRQFASGPLVGGQTFLGWDEVASTASGIFGRMNGWEGFCRRSSRERLQEAVADFFRSEPARVVFPLEFVERVDLRGGFIGRA